MDEDYEELQELKERLREVEERLWHLSQVSLGTDVSLYEEQSELLDLQETLREEINDLSDF